MKAKQRRFKIIIGLVVFILAGAAGLYWAIPVNTYYQNQVAVLMYHHFSEKDEGPISIKPKLFRDQIDYLRKNNYNFISLQQFREFMNGGTVPDNAVLLTFDDGYESVYKYAYPYLKENQIPGVLFLITKYLENPKGPYTSYLSPEEIREMRKNFPDIEVQSHTHNMHSQYEKKAYMNTPIPKADGQLENQQEYENRVASDFAKSVEELRPFYKKDYPIDSLAYPFGFYNPKSVELAQKAGIKFGFTVQPGIVKQGRNSMSLPRINAGSPNITPEKLLSTIEQQVDLETHYKNKIPLRAAMEQLGGEIFTDNRGEMSIKYKDKIWTVHAGSKEVEHEGKTITLKNPIERYKKRLYINVKDLSELLAIPLDYNEKTGQMTVKSEGS
ncbi:polysaccharide deacetylase family protein [Paenibacillus larvae]